jgi:hypothetical protein
MGLGVTRPPGESLGQMTIPTSASGLAARVDGGWAPARGGWPSLAAFIGLLLALAPAFALRLARVPPPS